MGSSRRRNCRAIVDAHAASALGVGVVSPLFALSLCSFRRQYYQRNRAHVCAFWLRGQCDKGDSCPYLHSQPETSILASAAAANAAANVNTADPVRDLVDHVLLVGSRRERKSQEGPPLPPSDTSITTLYLGASFLLLLLALSSTTRCAVAGGVDPKRLTESDLRTKLEAYGALKQVRCVPRKQCAFVDFEQREDAGACALLRRPILIATRAERAVTMLFGRFVVNGCNIGIAWRFVCLLLSMRRQSQAISRAQLQGRRDGDAADARRAVVVERHVVGGRA